VQRTDGYAAIRDYAAIGDGRTTALVARDGSVDWLCIPDVDSPPVFGRLLDAEKGGAFELAPEGSFEATRRYLPDTNVLETTFRTESGVVRVVDAMLLARGDWITPLRELVRRVECVEGPVRMRWSFDPRIDFAPCRRLELRDGRVHAETRTVALSLSLWNAGDPQLASTAAQGGMELHAGETALLQLAAAHREPLVLCGREEIESRLYYTGEFWRRWAARAEYDGPWRDEVVRSVLALKLLVFSPSGAIVAAPTTSLPEWLGGKRNWDYRYTWIRDASWSLDALLRLGYHDEAHAFFWWVMHASRLTQPRLQILYRVDGSSDVAETDRRDIGGYRGSLPVRLGNAAADQIQLDVYGEFLEAVWIYVKEGNRLDRATAKEVAEIADYVVDHWRGPDAGIWEVRSGSTHFIQSKALCWVALDRACSLAERGAISGRHAGRWRETADEIRAFVDEHGWDEELGAYIRAPDQRELDASILTLPILGYHGHDDERAVATVDAVRRELGEGPLVRRYRGGDGVGGEEGAFVTCSFWLVDALAHLGRLDEARSLMEELLPLANDVGLFAEEIDPASGDFLGNFPQALVHLALINAAVTIDDIERTGAPA
jgi:GH15 family glucan-1,4-alpha-glucosidase